ncbi:peptidase family C78-domain-containing protein [Xylariaceae sp. FL0255]|nr:peptidase family C78-domain-containing protein [Xylariaceae sp. FL0255]
MADTAAPDEGEWQALIPCPYCGYTGFEYDVVAHMEEEHHQDDSAFAITEETTSNLKPPHLSPQAKWDHGSETSHQSTPAGYFSASDAEGGSGIWMECPIAGCNELIQDRTLDDHFTEKHDLGVGLTTLTGDSDHGTSPAPTAVVNEYHSPYLVPRSQRSKHGSGRVVNVLDKVFGRYTTGTTRATITNGAQGTDGSGRTDKIRKRLGKAELGKFAHEHQMPDWLVKLLREQKFVSNKGTIPVLKELLEQNEATEWAYVCHPATEHISKLRNEGGFCGYRNIQTLVSYIVNAKALGVQRFPNGIPSVFEIQDMIESGWDKGWNAHARIETGGIKGTRKYIGTPEVETMMKGLGIACEAADFKNKEPGVSEARLLLAVQSYFERSGQPDPSTGNKVLQTEQAPIYFQHHGHSLTIVGLEKLKDGPLTILVFDPFFRDPRNVTDFFRQRTIDKEGKLGVARHKDPNAALGIYRRNHRYLKKYTEFEILSLLPSRPPPPDFKGDLSYIWPDGKEPTPPGSLD